MNKYIINGVDRITAEDKVLRLEAKSQEEAVNHAAKTLFISKVTLFSKPKPPKSSKTPETPTLKSLCEGVLKNEGGIRAAAYGKIIIVNIFSCIAMIANADGGSVISWHFGLIFLFSFVLWPIYSFGMKILTILASAGLLYAMRSE